MDSIPADDKRQVGPDLRHVNAKLSNAFLDSWIWSPKSFRPSTMMPHFFMLENSSSDEELRRTQQEVRAIRTFLTKTATPLPESDYLKDPANKMPEGEGDVDRGRSLFIGFDAEKAPIGDMQGGVGCVGCHTNLNETGQRWITNDMVKGGVLEDYLAEFRRKAVEGGGSAPSANALRQEAGREALRRYRAMTYNERQLYAMEHFGEALGASTIPKYPDGTPKPVFQHHGPELSGIGTKMLSGRSKEQARKWLYDWLIDPRHYSSYTVMPRLRLSPQDALDLAEYLLAQKRQQTKAGDDPWKAKEIAPDNEKVNELVAFFLLSKYVESEAQKHAVDGKELTDLAAAALTNKTTPAADAKKLVEPMSLEEKQLIFLGSKLINHYGCFNCHAINGMEGAASPCANLSDWGQKSVDKLDYGYLTHHKIPELPAEGARLPMVNGLSVSAVTQITDALNNKKWDERLSKDVQVAWPHIDHTRQSWLEHKLKNTRIYDRGKNLIDPVREIQDGKPVITSHGKPYDKLRMPTFYLNDEQVHALVTFVVSNKDRLVTPRLLEKVNTEQMKQLARGRQVAEKYNCVGCHQVESNTPPVQQYWLMANFFPKDEMTAKAPPSLRSEGARIQHSWVFNFMKHVGEEGTPLPDGAAQRRKMRPQPFIRMPSFPITDDDATAVAAYFNAVAVHEAKALSKKMDGLLKDTAKGKDGAPATQPVNPDDIWPADDWFAGNIRGESKYAAFAAELKNWALENTLAKPSDFAPDAGEESLQRAYKSALFDARIVAKSFIGSYPFAELSRPTPSKERFAKGEKLYHLMQCHTCHVLGNDAAEGVNKQPKGPNLSMTHRRIQRKWARHWVQEPQTIQPGNPMAAIFFSGRGIEAITAPNKFVFDLKGLPYIPSDRNPESIRSVQYEFGDTVDEQMELVNDFIYAAGFEGYTSKDPPQGEPKLTPAPKEAKLALLPGFTAPLPEPPAARGPTSRPTTPGATQGPVAANTSGPSITGKVMFVGIPPPRKPLPINAVPQCANHPVLGGKPLLEETLIVGKGGELKNAVVSIKNPPPGRHPIPAQPAVLDQVACHYSPHILPMMIGQPLVIKNSDPFLHNVHGLPQLNKEFNFGQNNVDPGRPVAPMTQAEEFRVKCDVHPWMNCQFVVFNHPFFAVTGDDGTFTINGLPPGTYTVTVWHEIEALRTEQQITVPAGKPAQANFSVKLEQ
jgi:mono/diheme cytochrome c family protein/cytochrome c